MAHRFLFFETKSVDERLERTLIEILTIVCSPGRCTQKEMRTPVLQKYQEEPQSTETYLVDQRVNDDFEGVQGHR